MEGILIIAHDPDCKGCDCDPVRKLLTMPKNRFARATKDERERDDVYLGVELARLDTYKRYLKIWRCR